MADIGTKDGGGRAFKNKFKTELKGRRYGVEKASEPLACVAWPLPILCVVREDRQVQGPAMVSQITQVAISGALCPPGLPPPPGANSVQLANSLWVWGLPLIVLVLETFHNQLRPVGTTLSWNAALEREREILVVDGPWRGHNGSGESIIALRVVVRQ